MDLTWYETLNKPLFTPPSSAFGPVWTILYLFMGISAVFIFRKGFKRKEVKSALKIFALQLFLNLIWSPVFFGLHNLFLAFVIIIAMWFLIYKTIKVFSRIDKNAAILLYPYLVWVSVATILNLSVLLLN